MDLWHGVGTSLRWHILCCLSEITFDSSNEQVMGYLVAALAGLQFVVAFIRPAPGAPRRPVWNFLHHNLGRGALLLAWATVYLGVYLAHLSYEQVRCCWWWWLVVDSGAGRRGLLSALTVRKRDPKRKVELGGGVCACCLAVCAFMWQVQGSATTKEVAGGALACNTARCCALLSSCRRPQVLASWLTPLVAVLACVLGIDGALTLVRGPLLHAVVAHAARLAKVADAEKGAAGGPNANCGGKMPMAAKANSMGRVAPMPLLLTATPDGSDGMRLGVPAADSMSPPVPTAPMMPN